MRPSCFALTGCRSQMPNIRIRRDGGNAPFFQFQQAGQMVSHRSHNPGIAGSTPAPATSLVTVCYWALGGTNNAAQPLVSCRHLAQMQRDRRNESHLKQNRKPRCSFRQTKRLAALWIAQPAQEQILTSRSSSRILSGNEPGRCCYPCGSIGQVVSFSGSRRRARVLMKQSTRLQGPQS